MLQHIRIFPFIIGIVLGTIAMFFIKPQQNVTYKYPTPETSGKVVYKDKNGVCYKYSAKQQECDKNEARLKDFPLIK